VRPGAAAASRRAAGGARPWRRVRLLLAGALAAQAAACGGERSPAPPRIVLVTLDTTRVDRLGVYGYAGRTSPNLDRFARDALVFDAAYTTSSWTLPAHASLFTGKLVSSHGARKDPQGNLSLATAVRDPGRWKHHRARGLAQGETTLAELLRAHGWATGAVVAGPWMKRAFGLAQGFDSYDDGGIDHVNGRRAADVTTSALAWIASHEREPFLLFLNYYDPHFPFDPPPLFAPARPAGEQTRLERLGQLYDAEIRYMDAELGRLLDGLAERGLYQGAWIVVTADHGEVLGEAGRMGHGETLLQVEIHVPLLVKYPGGEGPVGRTSEPVLITDLLPTLLGQLGIPVPTGLQGAPFPGPRHPIIAELHALPRASGSGDWRVIVEGDFKYVWNSRGPGWLANLAEDPGETRDFSGAHPELARRLRETLLSTLESLPPPAPADPEQEVDAETRRVLESLGYLD
jgi:arylsulfatase